MTCSDACRDHAEQTLREVLSLLVNGKTNKEIAKELTLSPTTVRWHVSNILSKLGASNRTEATALTLENKLVP